MSERSDKKKKQKEKHLNLQQKQINKKSREKKYLITGGLLLLLFMGIFLWQHNPWNKFKLVAEFKHIPYIDAGTPQQAIGTVGATRKDSLQEEEHTPYADSMRQGLFLTTDQLESNTFYTVALFQVNRSFFPVTSEECLSFLRERRALLLGLPGAIWFLKNVDIDMLPKNVNVISFDVKEKLPFRRNIYRMPRIRKFVNDTIMLGEGMIAPRHGIGIGDMDFDERLDNVSFFICVSKE